MSKKLLHEVVSEVIGAVRANPGAAPRIFGDAARRFRMMAREPANVSIAGKLNEAAAKFTEKAREASKPRFGTDFEVLLRNAAAAFEADPDADDLEFYGRLAKEAGSSTDFAGDEDEDEDEDEEGQDRGTDIVGASPSATTSPSGYSTAPTFHLKAAPPSVNGNTPLGRSSKLKWNPSQQEIRQGVKQSETVILWQGNKYETQTMTVDIGVIKPLPAALTDWTNPLHPPPPGAKYYARPYAQIEYGADGFREVVTVDVGTGTRLTVAGNYLSVLIGMREPPSPFVSATMEIGASMGFFAASSTAPVTYTEYFDGLGAGLGVYRTFSRPYRAVAFYPPQWTDTDPAAACDLTCYQADGSQCATFLFTNTANRSMTPIPIPSDCYSMRLQNTHLFVANFRIPFLLAL